MSAELLLDSGVIIAVERRRIDWESFAGQDDDVAIPVVVMAELVAGAYRADEANRQARVRFLNSAFERLIVEEYDARVVMPHAELLAHTAKLGRVRGAHDLIIAATAIATGRTLVTTDVKADFGALPGVQVRLVTP